MFMQNKSYSRELIAAVALWQNGWREDPEKKAQLESGLISEAQNLPDAAKLAPDRCYRSLLLDRTTISALFFNGTLDDRISSWTTDRALAAKFKSHLGNHQVGIIFSRQPSPHEVVVNIDNMWRDRDFLECLERYRREGAEFHKALSHFAPDKNNQSEVVLDVSKLKFADISGFSGRSSFDGICAIAGLTTVAEKDELWKTCLESGHHPDSDVFWLTEEGTWMVIDRVIDRMEELRDRCSSDSISPNHQGT